MAGGMDLGGRTAVWTQLGRLQVSQSGSAPEYEDLVRLIDTVVKDGSEPLFPSVSVAPAT